MIYPIDADKYIAAARREGIATELGEQVHRKYIIPVVNLCYRCGIDGLDGFPIDALELIDYIERDGPFLTDKARTDLEMFTAWCNEAYFQGVEDAAV